LAQSSKRWILADLGFSLWQTLGRGFDYFGHNKCVTKIKNCSGGVF
jgi:hypothetical protein